MVFTLSLGLPLLAFAQDPGAPASAPPADSPVSAPVSAPASPPAAPPAEGAEPGAAPLPGGTPAPPGAPQPDAQPQPPGSGGSNLPVAGGALRTLLLEAGFESVTGVVEGANVAPPGGYANGSQPPPGGHPDPSRPGAVHREVPHHGGGAAPGFLLLLTLPRSVVLPVRVVVGGVEFRPNDGGIERDAVGGDGIWTTMVERYPGGTALEVFAGDALLGTAPIELRPTDDIPELALTLP